MRAGWQGPALVHQRDGDASGQDPVTGDVLWMYAGTESMRVYQVFPFALFGVGEFGFYGGEIKGKEMKHGSLFTGLAVLN